jgi:hypothetical protein
MTQMFAVAAFATRYYLHNRETVTVVDLRTETEKKVFRLASSESMECGPG